MLNVRFRVDVNLTDEVDVSPRLREVGTRKLRAISLFEQKSDSNRVTWRNTLHSQTLARYCGLCYYSCIK